MNDNANLDIVASRVSSLESRVASVESQGSPDDVGVKAGLDGAPQPAVDPKGRKIWEAEWRQDYGVLIAYVPDNALVIDGENVEVEADDKDGDEVTVSEGSWYLHVFKNETTGSYEAYFDDSDTGTIGDEEAKYNIRIFDIHEDGYIEKQYVVGSIVLGKDGVTSLKGDDEDSEEVGGDVEIDCDKSGLTVKTELEEQDGDQPPKAKLKIDLKGRDDGDEFGIQTVTDSDGGEIAKVFATKGFVIPDGSSGVEADGKSIEFTGGTSGDSSPDEDDGGGGGDGGTSKLQIAGFDTAEAEDDSITDALLGNADMQDYMFIAKDGDGIKYVPVSVFSDFFPKEIKVDDDGKNCTVTPVKAESFKIPLGKTISSTNVSAGASGTQIKFNYTDGTSDTFSIQNGLPGQDGQKGDAPKITSSSDGSVTNIFADGVLIATVMDGHTPEITANKNGKITTISADGRAIATINDGEDGNGGSENLTEITVITGLSFEMSERKLVAKLTRKSIKAVDVSDLPEETVDVFETVAHSSNS